MLIGELCLPATVDIVICKLSRCWRSAGRLHTFNRSWEAVFRADPVLQPINWFDGSSRLSVAWLGAAGTEEILISLAKFLARARWTG